MTTVLRIQHATLAYQQKCVFADLNLELHRGEWSALLGPSGVGKTSLLRMIAGLLTPAEQTTGEISYPGASTSPPLEMRTTCIPQGIAYMAQQDLLLPWLTILQNTLLKTKLNYFSRKQRAREKAKAKSLLAQVGLIDALNLLPHQLSGGMRQRVALARMLMEDKSLILMDEPFAALDAITRYKLQDLAAELLKNKTVLFITHDPTEALRLANAIYIMQGTPAALHQVVTLTSNSPRKLTDPDVISLQATLFQKLTSENE